MAVVLSHVCDGRCFLSADATPAERTEHVAVAEALDRAQAAWDALTPEERAERLSKWTLGWDDPRTGSKAVQQWEDEAMRFR